MQQSSEPLAGRVAYVDLGPIQALEWASTDLDTLCLRGGFPNSLLAANEAASLRWREDFVRSYLQRDVPMFAPRLPAETVGRLWTMLAHQQGAFLQQCRLASGLGVSSPTLERYIDLQVGLQLVRRLRPWRVNTGKRLVKAPKVYVRDSGLVHALLGVEKVHELAGHPVCGLSYRSFASTTCWRPPKPVSRPTPTAPMRGLKLTWSWSVAESLGWPLTSNARPRPL